MDFLEKYWFLVFGIFTLIGLFTLWKATETFNDEDECIYYMEEE